MTAYSEANRFPRPEWIVPEERDYRQLASSCWGRKPHSDNPTSRELAMGFVNITRYITHI
jgi:hypothetical protein